MAGSQVFGVASSRGFAMEMHAAPMPDEGIASQDNPARKHVSLPGYWQRSRDGSLVASTTLAPVRDAHMMQQHFTGTSGNGSAGSADSISRPGAHGSDEPVAEQQLARQYTEDARGHGTKCKEHELVASAESKVNMRVLPLLLLLVVVCFIDRSNLAFASIQMTADLGFSPSTYGVGAGLFFVSYALMQVPSSILMTWLGGPLWLGSITLGWGICAAAFAAVRGPASFVLLRLALGALEAGAMPGVWLMLSVFYPPERLTLPCALVETGPEWAHVLTFLGPALPLPGITASQVVGAPLAGALLALDGWAGLRGWQWVFVCEGIPAVMFGFTLMFTLPRDIGHAQFLTAVERAALRQAVLAGHSSHPATEMGTGWGIAQSGPPGSEHGDEEHDAETQALMSPARGAQSVAKSHHSSLPACLQGADGSRVATACAGSGTFPVDPRAGMYTGSGSAPEARHSGNAGHVQGRISCSSLLRVLQDPCVLWPGAWRILHDAPGYAVLFFTPLIVQSLLNDDSGSPTRGSSSDTGGSASAGNVPAVKAVLLSAVPFVAASSFHVANAWHSQRVNEHRWHIAVVWLCGAAALAALPTAAASSTLVGFSLLTVAHMGLNGANGVQTSWVTSLLGPCQQHLALGLAVYNTIGNVGGFTGPVLMGTLTQRSAGSYTGATAVMAGSLACAAAMVIGFGADRWRGIRWARGGRQCCP